MFSRILVPVDSADAAKGALGWAEWLAAQAEADLFLLHVVEPVTGMFAVRPTPTLLAAAATEQEHDVAAATTALSNATHALHGRGLRASRYVQVGMPATKISEFIKAHSIDLVVMGTHARSGLPRALLGSVADEVRREAAVPVFLVPINSSPPLGECSILICLDESAEAESALDAGLTLAQGLAANATVLEVADQTSVDTAAAYLAGVSQTARDRGLLVSSIVGRGEPGPDILLKAAALQADVIALASRGRSSLARAVFGSVATYVLTHSRVPLLLTRRSLETAPDSHQPNRAVTSGRRSQ